MRDVRPLPPPGAAAPAVRRSAPVTAKHLPGARHALQLVRREVLETEPRAGHELLRGARDQDVAGIGQRHHPRTDHHRDAVGLAGLILRLARVDAGADLDAEAPDLLGERCRASDRPVRLGEGGEEAVAGVILLLPPEALESGPDEPVEPRGELAVSSVAQSAPRCGSTPPRRASAPWRSAVRAWAEYPPAPGWDSTVAHRSGRSSSGTRSANVHAVHRSAAVVAGSRETPRRAKCSHTRATSRARSDSACRFFFGSTACGRSITQICPSHTRTLNGDRSPWITSWKSMRSIDEEALLEQLLGLRLISLPIPMELRRGLVLVADVGHQDRPIRDLDGSRHRRSRLGQGLQGFPFPVDPDAALHLATEPRALVEGDADPTLLDELAIAVDGLVAEVSPVEGVIDLQRRQLFAGRARVGTAEVDTRLLAALDGSDDPFDEPFVEEVLDDFVSQGGCSFARTDADMRERRVLRELPRESRTAQRETEGRNARTVTELAVIIHPSFIVDATVAPNGPSIRARGRPSRSSRPRRATAARSSRRPRRGCG